MKKQFILLFIVCLALHQCTYSNLGAPAVITGWDPRYCACCGGLKIIIQNSTPAGEFYLIQNSSDLGIDMNATFPINAIVTYTMLPNTCGGKHVFINSFRRV